jgi:hypothetical protein
VKRVVVLMLVAMVVVAMLAVTAGPAFAQLNKSGTQACREDFQQGGASPQHASLSCTPSQGYPSLEHEPS